MNINDEYKMLTISELRDEEQKFATKYTVVVPIIYNSKSQLCIEVLDGMKLNSIELSVEVMNHITTWWKNNKSL